MALYQQAEVHRLRGEFAEAEEAYRQAGQWGREPQPGLAMLRLAQGQVDAAAAAIRRVRTKRTTWWPGQQVGRFVEIMLAAGDLGAAGAAAEELAQIADDLGALLLHAVSGHANGAVLLGEGDARAALVVLRRALAAWRELDAPYEAARAQVLIGLACRELGDRDAAEMELDAACLVFRQLGAGPIWSGSMRSRNRRTQAPMGLTGRSSRCWPSWRGQDQPRDRSGAGHQ